MDKLIELVIGDKATKKFVWFVFALYLLVDKGPSWIELFKEKPKPQPQVIGLSTTEEPHNTSPDVTKPTCVSYLPLDDVDIKVVYDRMAKRNGLLSPTGGGNTWEGIVWIVKQIDPNFKKIFVEYEIVPDEKGNKPPSIIWSIARTMSDNKRQHIAKIWIPEFSNIDGYNIPQLIGFAKNNDYTLNSFEREMPLSLPDAVKLKQIDTLIIEPTSISGNEMVTNFTYTYTSDRTGVATSFPFSKKISFPFSNLKDSNEKLDIGLGSYAGNGLRLISLQVCY